MASSYTPTIRALLYARSHHRPAGPAGTPDVLVVAMRRTPGAAPLPGAAAEAEVVSQHFGAHTRTLQGNQATHRNVSQALRTARRAHFACHAHADLASPSASYLLLDDHQHKPLTVTDITRMRLGADLAFLSACATADPGELPDEAIHLTSAFQLAGYRHVIGTLWPIADETAVEFARRLYKNLVGTGPDTAALALHAATRQLRDQSPNAPYTCASHIHTGP